MHINLILRNTFTEYTQINVDLYIRLTETAHGTSAEDEIYGGDDAENYSVNNKSRNLFYKY